MNESYYYYYYFELDNIVLVEMGVGTLLGVWNGKTFFHSRPFFEVYCFLLFLHVWLLQCFFCEPNSLRVNCVSLIVFNKERERRSGDGFAVAYLWSFCWCWGFSLTWYFLLTQAIFMLLYAELHLQFNRYWYFFSEK